MSKKTLVVGSTLAGAAGLAAFFLLRDTNQQEPGEQVPTDPTPEPTPEPTPTKDIIKSFSISKKSGTAPLSVGFSVTVGDPRSIVEWNFGDGATDLDELSVSHTYFSAGLYNGFVRVTTPEGNSDSRTFTITVKEEQEPQSDTDIITSFDPPDGTGIANSTEFTGSIALGVPQDDIDSIRWDWGDGFVENNVLVSSHVYSSAGSFNGKVTVKALGKTETRNFTILATDSPEIQDLSIDFFPRQPEVGQEVLFQPQGTGFPSAGVDFLWRFGDGSPIIRQEDLTERIRHTYTRSGSFKVELVMTDENNVFLARASTIIFVVASDDQPQLGDVELRGISVTRILADGIDVRVSYRVNISTGGEFNIVVELVDSNGITQDIQFKTVSFDKTTVDSIADFSLSTQSDGPHKVTAFAWTLNQDNLDDPISRDVFI